MTSFSCRQKRVDGLIARSMLPAFGLKKLIGHQRGKITYESLMNPRNCFSVRQINKYLFNG